MVSGRAARAPHLASATHAPANVETFALAQTLLASGLLVLAADLGSRHALCARPEGIDGARLGDLLGLAVLLLRGLLRVEGPSCLRGRRGVRRHAAIAPGIEAHPSDHAQELRGSHFVRLAVTLGAQVAGPGCLHAAVARILRCVLVAHVLEARGLAILLRALLREISIANAARVLPLTPDLHFRSVGAVDLEQRSLLLRGAAEGIAVVARTSRLH